MVPRKKETTPPPEQTATALATVGAPKGAECHQPHVCTAQCDHKCGDVGGRTARGKPCRKPGGWGIKGKPRGYWALCRDHDPDVNQEYAFEGLVGKHARFVFEYCGRANANATKAARLAGYSPNGSRVTLQVIGSRLLAMPKIKAAILKRYDTLAAPGEEIIKRMTDDARLDMSELIIFDEDGRPSVTLTEESLKRFGTLIREIETDTETGEIRKIKLNDSQAARRDLAKIRQLFSDAPTINVFQLQDLSDDELTQQMNTARQRLRAPPRHEEAP